jgi:hypothetical protein
MSCNHPRKSNFQSMKYLLQWVLHLLECPSNSWGKKIEGNMPSMDTYTNLKTRFLCIGGPARSWWPPFEDHAALSAADLCSSLEMRGGPVEQAFHSVKYNRFLFELGGNVPSIEQSILSARRCFQIQQKKPSLEWFLLLHTIELSVVK